MEENEATQFLWLLKVSSMCRVLGLGQTDDKYDKMINPQGSID